MIMMMLRRGFYGSPDDNITGVHDAVSAAALYAVSSDAYRIKPDIPYELELICAEIKGE